MIALCTFNDMMDSRMMRSDLAESYSCADACACANVVMIHPGCVQQATLSLLQTPGPATLLPVVVMCGGGGCRDGRTGSKRWMAFSNCTVYFDSLRHRSVPSTCCWPARSWETRTEACCCHRCFACSTRRPIGSPPRKESLQQQQHNNNTLMVENTTCTESNHDRSWPTRGKRVGL